MEMDTFTFDDVSFTEEDMQDTSLEELRGSLPVFSPLRFTAQDKRQQSPLNTPCTKRQRLTSEFHKALSFGDCPISYSLPSTEVKQAMCRIVDTENIRGDGTGPCSLPTVKGKHPDLKSIDSNTLVAMLSGAYQGIVDRFQIIDCRYPYEYKGGHIQGAVNMYRESDITEFLMNNINNPSQDVLIFHCEFSSERAPKMCRHLRNKDRELNADRYPFLNFPEVYILDGGYKAFFSSYQSHCEPQSYIPMLHKDHKAEIRHFRSKSKSWTAGEKRKSPQRLLF